MKLLAVISLSIIFALTSVANSADPIVNEAEAPDRVFFLAGRYFAEFQDPETGVLYGARFTEKDSWTSPEDVLAEKPHPWGYGSRIADTALHTGHMLVALLDAYEARPDPFLKKQIARCFEALKLIGSLPETYPKPNQPALEGLVPRGPHPNDPSAYYDDSSMDQHTTYIISLAVYANSSLATEEDRQWIRESLGKVGRRLEDNGWSIKRADGVTQSHVGFSWTGFNSDHASILLPALLALYRGTGDDHWLERYEFFLIEADGKRWRQSHAGPHVRINGHPIYANQNAFRVHAWYRFEENANRKQVIGGLLVQSTRMQLAREFPGEFYRKYHDDEVWSRLSENFDWGDSELRGAAVAWDKFTPNMLDSEDESLATLAHVRFPLGGFHMVLLSEQPRLIREHLPAIWEMLNTVDLEKVEAGETHYLFTVVGLHLYALHARRPELFSATTTGESDTFGDELPIAADAGTGPVIDVAVQGDHAFAIGRGALYALDVRVPTKPRIVGSLSGLGSVRQIVVRNGFAYVTSRQDGLFVLDVKDPANPKRLNHFDTIEFATGVAISGDLLFVACRGYGVQLINVSDPSHPTHISLVRTGEAQSVVARNGYLYVGVWAASEVVVVDVQNPWRPRITARVPLDGFGDGVDVMGDFLYVATGHHSRETPRRNPGDPGFGRGHGLEVFEIRDPAQPKFVSRVKFPPLYEMGNDMWGVTVANGYAFVADTWNGMFVVDVTDPRDLRIVGRRELPLVEELGKPGYAGGLSVMKDYVLLAGGYTDLHVVAARGMAAVPDDEPDLAPPIGVSPPAHEEQQDRWRIYRPEGQVHAVDFLDDRRAVVACGAAGVHIVKLWPEIERLSVISTEGFATDVSVSGSRIFIAEGAGGLSCWEFEDSANHSPRRVGRFLAPGKAIRQVEVPGGGTRALIQAGANHFLILDVSDPANPKRLLEDSRHGLLYGDQMMRGLIEDRYAAVFWHVSGIHWYDLQATGDPIFTGANYAQRIGSANGLIAFEGNTLATVRGGYVLLDRSERRPIEELSVHPIGAIRSHPGVPSISGRRLYTANRSTGLITISDMSDPTNPELIEQFQTSGNPGRIAIRNGLAVIPNGYRGLLLEDR